MKIGLKTRFSDFDQVMELDPEFVEFQFSDKDADYPFSPKIKYPIPAIIHLPEFWSGHLIDISNIKPENQVLPLNESLDILQNIISKSEKFFSYFTNERNIFILHPGGMSYEKDIPKNNIYRMETLIKSLSLLRTENSEILVENLPPLPWYFGGQWNSNIFMDGEEIGEFCKTTKRKICYDISHSKLYCNYAKKDFMAQFEIFIQNMAHLHIADATGEDGEGVQIGDGEINFKPIFEKLKKYKGMIVPEIWLGYTDGFAGFKTAVKRIRNLIK
ncbi:sugar phosphate isomerase/epimerase [Patescibacteria group bacterium]|nr:sugar phosphate isomerase/epimerase [Patescibacteria group bacterium]MCL5798033.1 sugar phosphate isomerase/epimerase [Patescibacteria group bacterium]